MIQSIEQIWLAIEPVDMRLGIDGLSLRVQQSLGCTPCNGHAYIFRNKRANRLKLVAWDGTGAWLAQRRLHHGRFAWAHANQAVYSISCADWQWLITGVDWQRLSATASKDWQF